MTDWSDDKKEALEEILQGMGDGEELEDADDELKADHEFVLKVVRVFGSALQYADDVLKADREIVLAAVHQAPWALEYANNELKSDREIVLAAVKMDGDALEFADDDLKADQELVLAAVHQSENALQYASDSLREDPEILKAANKAEAVIQSLYRISTKEKKRVSAIEFYVKDGLEIKYSQGWRTGMVEAKSPNNQTGTEIPSDLDDYDPEDGIDAYNTWELEDFEFMDGVSDSIEFPDALPDEERERLEEIFYESGVIGLESEGWEHMDTEVWFFGDLNIEKK